MKFKTAIAGMSLLLAAGWIYAETTDEALNAAYKKALASNHDGELQWTELHWIAYRDAEANLQAWIAGKSSPDEAARESSLNETTRRRTTELLQTAAGKPGDISPDNTPVSPANAGQGLSAADAYAALRSKVIAQNNADLISALILSQKAWLDFSELQGAGSEEAMRLKDLLADAKLLNIDLGKIPPEPDQDGLDRNTEVSPDHLLRIEQTGDHSAWVISNQTGARAQLPLAADEANVGRGQPTVEVSEFSISPDGRWIFRTQKFYHGMCGAYLYERASGLNYKAATDRPLDLPAWEYFGKMSHMKDATEGGVVNFVAWKNGRLRISLNASSHLTFGDVDDWRVDYDPETKSFSVPDNLKESDRKAFDPSSQRNN